MNSTQEIIAAADGSALGNPGPAGWAWYIDDDHWASGGWAHGTNNMGELKAVLDLFEATASRPEAKLRVYCDSQYVINSLTKWMPGWKKKGWKKSDGKPVLNRDLLEALDAALAGRDYEFIWVKGHAGHELNEKADSLANGAARAYQEGREPAHGPGFGASAEADTAAEPAAAPVVEAPIVNAPAAEPALSESSADAHLPVQEFTAAEIENAQRGVESLRLSGLLRPASAVNAPDPEAVRTRKEQLALAAERAAERDAKALARQQETAAQQASSAAQAEEEDDLTGLEEFAGLDPNDVDPAELLGETEEQVAEQVAEPAVESVQDAPAQPAEPAPVAPAPSAPAAPAAPAPNPEEASAAEQLLESRGSVMEAAQLESMLHERLVWVTATGKSVSRSSVLQYRERAFTQQGAPLKQGVQVLDSSSVLVMAAVATARGRVSRSSIWHYDGERALWRLRFRQETPAS
ncbi:MAG: ribonuclease HI family protein [Rothia sp.]|uniref:ribonuclease HI family protein n=1 Tax=Rothia sp. (in: high G+C Gram-positive bacteria) TaxID=1885016 RepID=UPI001CB5A5F2|nr:ribonuclease HI family protein [Rothia sp. (in: high G+C Gram-positive bacteria)]MBF1680197.1 ribonuclease HI family protein [Rothia sp. (in: high G+C Gram-positive bacteria)]